MTKSIFIDPKEVRKPGYITFENIPMNQYQKKMRDVAGDFSRQALLDIFYDMICIREFETMMQDLRLTGKYCGIAYDYSGPAHLGIGQESAAVGQAYLLDPDDIVFGTHRSHPELIAKGFSALRKLDGGKLEAIMKESGEGAQYAVVSRHFKLPTAEMAKRFYLYGIMAEIFGRKNGFAKGLGNSMHAFFIPFGVYPNNAIVGGSAPIAAGAALYKKNMKKPGIVIANAGDGSLGCGPVWEAMNFASMDQYNTLWEDGYRGGLPVLFNFNNNGYGMGGQTCGETMAYRQLARVGAGINIDQMHAERVDGFNVFAVIDAIRRKKKLLLEGKGPVLLDVITYRFCGHSTSDANPNRTQEEIEAWRGEDAIADYELQLLENGIADAGLIREIKENIREMMVSIFKLATDDSISPRMDILSEPDSIEKYMFSNRHMDKMDDGKPDMFGTREENPRVERLGKKSRSGLKNGKVLPSSAVIQLRDAIFESVLDKFYTDPTLVSFGEDLRIWGSAYGAYKDLDKSVPYHRLFNSGISESAIIGASVGYAMLGGRALPELMYCDFLGRAGDEVLNQLAKWQGMTAGQIKMPVVVRMGVGAKYGAQHSQDWSGICAHVPGLKVVFPVTPYDTKGLLNAALSGSDPVIFLENQKLYGEGEIFQPEGVPEGYYEVPIGEPDIKRKGSDITILTIGATLYKAIEAARLFEEGYGISAEVIDARSIIPFHFDPVIESVKKTGKIIIASDACRKGSIINDFAQTISECAFNYLDAPPIVIGARNWITPAYELENDFFPQPDWFLDAYHQKIKPLPGYTPKRAFGITEMNRRNLMGV